MRKRNSRTDTTSGDSVVVYRDMFILLFLRLSAKLSASPNNYDYFPENKQAQSNNAVNLVTHSAFFGFRNPPQLSKPKPHLRQSRLLQLPSSLPSTPQRASNRWQIVSVTPRASARLSVVRGR